MKENIVIAITAASYSGNKGAAAMLQSSIRQLHERFGDRLRINLMSVYPIADAKQLPFDFIRIVSCTPKQLLFLAFPLAVLHWLFRWLPPVRLLLEKNKILKAYRQTDLVVDEAGISFVDSRGFVMNVYAFVCAAVPLLLKTPVVKYSQAMGSFKSCSNRFLAKWILPKLSLICARGQGTYDHLKGIGINENVKLCADGAFTMADSPKWNREVDEVCKGDRFYQKDVVGLSISSVVAKKCVKLGIDYEKIMVGFIEYLTGQGFNVLIIANAARIQSEKLRNNDLPTGDAIFKALPNKENVRWYHKEMDAEEIRAYIGKCRVLVASRFHAMIGSLEQRVPVLLVGWSHKYQEVLDMFGIGQYAIDFSKLNLESLCQSFEGFMKSEQEIRGLIDMHYDEVMESSRDNIRYISEVADQVTGGLKRPVDAAAKKAKKKKLFKVFKIIFVVLVLIFMTRFFVKNIDDIRNLDFKLDWKVFGLSMLFYVVYKFNQASLWHYITRLDKASVRYGKALTAYLYSILGKYIPGKVFMLAARIPPYEESGVPMRKITVCFLLENVCTLLGAGFLFLISLFFFPNDLLKDYFWLTIAFVIVFFVCIHPKIINFFLRFVEKLTKKKDMQIPFSYFQMLKVVVLFIFNWALVGVGFYMLVCSIYPLPASNLLYAAGVFGLSAIIGILAIFAPSGIGVREGIMIFGLGLIMSQEYAVIISIVSRLWVTIAELLLIFGAFVVNRIKIAKNKKLK